MTKNSKRPPGSTEERLPPDPSRVYSADKPCTRQGGHIRGYDDRCQVCRVPLNVPRSAKVTVLRVSVEGVVIEVPDTCPGCGADLRGKQHFLECGWMAVEQECSIIVDRDGIGVSHEFGDYRDFREIQIVTGYRCKACRAVVAGAEC